MNLVQLLNPWKSLRQSFILSVFIQRLAMGFAAGAALVLALGVSLGHATGWMLVPGILFPIALSVWYEKTRYPSFGRWANLLDILTCAAGGIAGALIVFTLMRLK
jgi:hypothetical protein